MLRDSIGFALSLLLSPWWGRSILTARYNAPVLLAAAQQRDEQEQESSSSPCADPLGAILSTLDCVERKDVACATAGYNSAAFVKLHNGVVDTNTTIDAAGVFWSVAFELVTIRLNYDHAINVPNAMNTASIRYVETVNFTTGVEFGGGSPLRCLKYPFGQSYSQREHAIVTVDDDCKMIKWDQYGDNREQAVVDETAAAILSDPAVRCHYAGVLFFPEDEACQKNRTITCRRDAAARHNDDDEDGQKVEEAATSQDHCGVSMT